MRLGESICACQRGVTAIEFGLVLPVLLLFVFGLIDFGRAIWVQTTLNYAVEYAARCGAIDIRTTDSTRTCYSNLATDPTQIKAYAVTQAYALSLSSSNFSVIMGTSSNGNKCDSGEIGVQVKATYAFSYFFPVFAGHSGPFTATACYPT